MTKIITSVLTALGLKAKDLSLDAQATTANAIADEAVVLFKKAADGLDLAANAQRSLAEQYAALSRQLYTDAAAASDAADGLDDAADVTEMRAEKLRDLFGV